MTKLIGYVRVSTEDQAKHGVSLDAQRERLAKWCEDQGHTLVRVEADEGVSGSIPPGKRPGLAAVLTAISTREVGGIVATKFDRISRDAEVLLGIRRQAMKKGWDLFSISEPTEVLTSQGFFMYGINSLMAETESLRVCERTKEALARVRAEGRGAGGRIPFGYRNADGDGVMRAARFDAETGKRIPDRRPLVVCPQEQEQIEIIQRLQTLGLGATRIAKELGESPRTGKPWNVSTLRCVMRTLQARAILEIAI